MLERSLPSIELRGQTARDENDFDGFDFVSQQDSADHLTGIELTSATCQVMKSFRLDDFGAPAVVLAVVLVGQIEQLKRDPINRFSIDRVDSQ